MKAIDLFCGAGGLTVGLKMAGFEVVSAVEKEPIVSETYLQNHPDVSLLTGDIRALSPTKIMNELGLQRGQLELLAGCPRARAFQA